MILFVCAFLRIASYGKMGQNVGDDIYKSPNHYFRWFFFFHQYGISVFWMFDTISDWDIQMKKWNKNKNVNKSITNFNEELNRLNRWSGICSFSFFLKVIFQQWSTVCNAILHSAWFEQNFPASSLNICLWIRSSGFQLD